MVLTQPNHINPVRGNVVLLRQILDDRLGATLTEVVVVVLAADGIGSAFQRQNPMLGIGNVVGQFVESLLGFLGQNGLIEAKVHRGFSDYMVVIQISHLVGQRVHASRG